MPRPSGPPTPRKRAEMALRGDPVDGVPFTVYECMLPTCSVERELRNKGLCIVNRRIPVVLTHTPDVKTTTTTYTDNGKTYARTDVETPFGVLTSISEPAGFTSWTKRHIFNAPEDYRKLIFIEQNKRYETNYAPFLKAQDAMGEDVILRGGIGLEPLQDILMKMGTERFCLEWMDRRDEILKLYDAIVESHRKLYPLLADSPAWHFNYGGNVTVEILSPAVVRDYYIPRYNEAAEVLHKKGKLIGSHLDANCRLIAKMVAESQLDYIEAFTPAPDTDMTLAEAFAGWPDKAVWINFPSSLHLASTEKIAQTTREFVAAAKTHPRFLIGITEDVPEDRWQQNFMTIMRAIEENDG